MKIIKNIFELNKAIKNYKNIGFVPTMGGIHKGHASLIKISQKNNKKTIVSIFVNPTQFNVKKDFKKYPRNIKKDISILKKLKVSYLYKPSYSDIFKFKTKNKIFLDQFSKKLCGKYRRGHFKGVVDVVNRLLEIIMPKKILLGQKDFQQLVLIKKHIIKNKINTKVISCKTIRDKDFVAYSSRLKRLNNHQRFNLVMIINYLRAYKRNLLLKKITHNPNKIKKRLLILGAKKVDYVEILNLKTLKKPKNNKNLFNIFIAYKINNIRLIDNF